MTFRDVCVGVLLVAGVGIQLVCCVGIVVMRDALDRLHCVGAAAFGAALVAVAIVVRESFSLIGNKALAVGFLLLFTGPVLAHVTARTIRIRELRDWRIRERGDLEVEGE